jgi:hypothetical protein
MPHFARISFLAFASVCRTEEAKLQAFENTPSENPNVSNAAMAAHRNTLREELLRR